MLEKKLIDKIYKKYDTIIIELKDHLYFNNHVFVIDSFCYFEISKQLFEKDLYYFILSTQAMIDGKPDKLVCNEKICEEYSNYINEHNYNIFLIYKNNPYGLLIDKKQIKLMSIYMNSQKKVNDFLIFLNNQEIKHQII